MNNALNVERNVKLRQTLSLSRYTHLILDLSTFITEIGFNLPVTQSHSALHEIPL